MRLVTFKTTEPKHTALKMNGTRHVYNYKINLVSEHVPSTITYILKIKVAITLCFQECFQECFTCYKSVTNKTTV